MSQPSAAIPRDAQDPAAVEAFLVDRYGAGVTDVAEVGRGEWSVAYGYVLDGHDYVARFGRHRDDFEKDALAARFASPALPVPRVREIGAAFGGVFAVSERIFGEPLDTLDEAAMRAVLPSLFAAIDAMRAADTRPYTGYGMWDGSGAAPFATWQDWLLDVANDDIGGRVGGWRARLASQPGLHDAFERAYAVLRSLCAGLPAARHLLHNDPLNRNIFVKVTRVSGVIDWGCGAWGDFVYDLAHFSFSTFWFPAWGSIDFAAEAERHYAAIGLDVPAFRDRLRCYELHIGLQALAYTAYLARWRDAGALARRTLEAAGLAQQ